MGSRTQGDLLNVMTLGRGTKIQRHPPPQVHLSLQGPEVRLKLEERRPGPGVVLSTTNRPVTVWTPVSVQTHRWSDAAIYV